MALVEHCLQEGNSGSREASKEPVAVAQGLDNGP